MGAGAFTARGLAAEFIEQHGINVGGLSVLTALKGFDVGGDGPTIIDEDL